MRGQPQRYSSYSAPNETPKASPAPAELQIRKKHTLCEGCLTISMHHALCMCFAGPGLTVEHTKDAAGVVCKRSLRHHVLLGGIYADTPAQRKLSKWMGHGGYLGCGHCMLLGTVGPTGHGMYFQGYEEERAADTSPFRILLPDNDLLHLRLCPLLCKLGVYCMQGHTLPTMT